MQKPLLYIHRQAIVLVKTKRENVMNILKIGSSVKCTGIKFSARLGGLSQCFSVDDVFAVKGWRTHVYCKNMFAISSHKLGVFW